MGWYTVGIAFQTGMQDHMEASISLVAVHGASAELARSRAEQVGRSLAAAYEWEFGGVLDVHEVADEKLDEGVELYSFFADQSLLDAIREQVSRARG